MGLGLSTGELIRRTQVYAYHKGEVEREFTLIIREILFRLVLRIHGSSKDMDL